MISSKMDRAIEHARRTSPILPSAIDAIVNKIPESLIYDPSITPRHLSIMMLALHRHWLDAATFTERTIINEGCVYDKEREELLEVVSRKDCTVLPRVI
ncbi:MAG: hypothetical protein JW780_06035 [Clostridiales bacterium]|nr:hypothetical protein [Clostridiales bacterium]